MGKTRLVRFENTPFPFEGEVWEGRPFLDVNVGGRRGHTSVRGGVYWQDQTYSEKRVLLSIPRNFDPTKPVTIVVFFHGNGAKLDRDVDLRQQVPRQVAEAGRNAVLVAPSFAVDALDSSAGRFWEPGMFRAFLDEAAVRLAELWGTKKMQPIFAKAPVVLVAYSGGYQPAAYSLMYGEADDRVQGVVLLDALFGEMDKFVGWIARKPDTFLVSAYSGSTTVENRSLQRLLREEHVRFDEKLPRWLSPGAISVIGAPEAVHNDFVTKAWAEDPLKVILSRVPRPPRAGPPVAMVPLPKTGPRPPLLGAPLPFAAPEAAGNAGGPLDLSSFRARWPEREFDRLVLPRKRKPPA